MRVIPIILLPFFIQSLLSLGNTTWRDGTKAMVSLIVVWVVVTGILTAIVLARRIVVIGVYGVVVLAIAVRAVVVFAVVVLAVVIRVLVIIVQAPIALVDVRQAVVIVGTITHDID